MRRLLLVALVACATRPPLVPSEDSRIARIEENLTPPVEPLSAEKSMIRRVPRKAGRGLFQRLTCPARKRKRHASSMSPKLVIGITPSNGAKTRYGKILSPRSTGRRNAASTPLPIPASSFHGCFS